MDISPPFFTHNWIKNICDGKCSVQGNLNFVFTIFKNVISFKMIK